MRGFLILFSILTALVGMLFYRCADAHASIAHFARTEISWAGTFCVSGWSAAVDNRFAVSYTTICPGEGHYFLVEPNLVAGEYFGVSIPLTGQTYVHCATFLDGVLQGEDDAYSNLGSGQANCLRVVN